jgi:3-hydroxy-9,10-secoandrosta-1,3,5(10)-triene-9,17-dione monooxygenase
MEVAASTEGLSKHEMIDRARALAPAFRKRAGAAERERRLPGESAQELLAGGFARMLVPRRLGGSELGLDAWLEVMLEIGRADASHAWCAGLMAHVPHMLLQLGAEAQQAIWGEGPDVPTAGSVMPFSKVDAAPGGYLVSGQAPFASGVTHSTWVFVGGFLPREGDTPTAAMFLIPPGSYQVSDTWFTSGMRGTGSNTIVTDNVFVPAPHVLRISDLREATGPGTADNPGGIYQLPFMAYAPLSFVTPMLGAAQGAFNDFLTWAKGKRVPGGGRLAEGPSAQAAIGRISGDLEAAELLLRWVVQTATETDTETETNVSRLEHRRKCMRNYSRAADLVVDAIDGIVRLGSTSSFTESNPAQRAWRDIHFAAAHVSLQGDINYAQWARGELNIPTPSTLDMY